MYKYDYVWYQGKRAYLDYCILDKSSNVIALSFYGRDIESVRAVTAAAMAGQKIALEASSEIPYKERAKSEKAVVTKTIALKGLVTEIDKGHDRFHHSVLAPFRSNEKTVFITDEEHMYEDFYNFLMQKFDFPLLPEWSKTIYKTLAQTWMVSNDVMRYSGQLCRGYYSASESLKIGQREIPFDKAVIVYVPDTDDKCLIEKAISELLASKEIVLCDREQKPLLFEDMDTYFKQYGQSIVEHLKGELRPLAELDGDAKTFTTKQKRLYPQQIAMVNGVKSLLYGVGNKKERRKSAARYCFMNEGMGSGKTLQAAVACDSYFVSKELQKNNNRKPEDRITLSDIYKDAVEHTNKYANYSIIWFGPSHIMEKTGREIQNEIPGAKVTMLQTFEDLLKVYREGKPLGKNFFLISKDFAKLDYMKIPVPSKLGKGYFYKRFCRNDGQEVVGCKCRMCAGTDYTFQKTATMVSGLKCPECGKVLLPYKAIPTDEIAGLTPTDFAKMRDSNARCIYCNSELWQPFVPNIGTEGKGGKKWKRMTHYSNKAHKGTETVWVLDGEFEKKVGERKEVISYAKQYLNETVPGEDPLNFPATEGFRRCAPAHFIKNHMKGFFDLAVFDEVHEYKSGESAQGNAMHALIKATKKQLCLTGTIAGGKATDLYYLLFRLEPQRMVSRGYRWSDSMRFAEKYGSLETMYEAADYEKTGNYNVCSKGKQLTSPKVKPGISPLIFIDFLLDRCVFLDITDMSSKLPPLKEMVVESEVPDEIAAEYRNSIDLFKAAIKGGYGASMMSAMLQYGLSYLDKPYGREPVLNPTDGSIFLEPASFPDYRKELLPKDEELIRIINKEVGEGRNVFVYAEYTASAETSVTQRLKEIIEDRCRLEGKVAILESSSPQALKRESWMIKKASEGVKVFITNPRCVETGLDFIFKNEGKVYNFPTIIFYQIGYSMFTVMQASRRHYRLNQTQECRTYYLTYSGSAQAAALGIIAEKMSATGAIQGKFSSEGLSAMAAGTDIRVKLAQAMCSLDKSTGNNLQEMFDVANNSVSETDEAYAKYKPMKLLSEIVEGVEVISSDEKQAEKPDFFSMLSSLNGFFSPSPIKEERKEEEQAAGNVKVEAPSVVPEILEVASATTSATLTVESGNVENVIEDSNENSTEDLRTAFEGLRKDKERKLIQFLFARSTVTRQELVKEFKWDYKKAEDTMVFLYEAGYIDSKGKVNEEFVNAAFKEMVIGIVPETRKAEDISEEEIVALLEKYRRPRNFDIRRFLKISVSEADRLYREILKPKGYLFGQGYRNEAAFEMLKMKASGETVSVSEQAAGDIDDLFADKSLSETVKKFEDKCEEQKTVSESVKTDVFTMAGVTFILQKDLKAHEPQSKKTKANKKVDENQLCFSF